MAKEDIKRALEWAIADGVEIMNDVAGVACMNCDELIPLEPGTHEPLDDQAVAARIESFFGAEPHEIRMYCSEECKREDMEPSGYGDCFNVE